MHSESNLSVSEVPLVHPADADLDLEVLKGIPKGFVIDSEEKANWLVRKVGEARKYSEHVKEWADRELRRAAREEQMLMFLFGRQIESWTRDEIDKLRGRRKSLNLPAGSVGFRSTPPRIVVDDETQVLLWAKRFLPTAVIVVEKLAKSILNDHCGTTGEIPEVGVHVESAGEKFYIK